MISSSCYANNSPTFHMADFNAGFTSNVKQSLIEVSNITHTQTHNPSINALQCGEKNTLKAKYKWGLKKSKDAQSAALKMLL